MIYAFLAEGFEETELVAPLDIMRRAGIEVTTVGVGGKQIAGAHNITITADIALDEFSAQGMPKDISGVFLPGGGKGVENLEQCQTVINTIKFCEGNDLFILAICAAPSILGKLGVLDFKKAVCYPGFEEFMGKAIMQPQQTTAVADGNFITGKGAGAAIEFGLLIVEVLKGKQTALDLAKTLQCPMQSYK